MLKSWCFSNRERIEKCLLKSDVANTAEEMVFEWRMLSSGVSAMGKKSNGEKLLNSGVSAMGKCEKLLNSGVSAMGKMVKNC
jgi:hypothetical protein